MLNKCIKLKHQIDGNAEYVRVEEPLNEALEPHQVCVKITCCVLRTPSNILQRFFNKVKESVVPVGREISGTVEKVGESVTFCKPGDQVVGIIPLDSAFSGCGSYCVISEFDIVLKPDDVTHLNAACVIGDALKAYTALFYQANVVSGQTIVIASAAQGLGIVMAQLAIECGLQVIAIVSSDEEISFLRSLDPPANQVVDLRDKKNGLVATCLHETGGLGVDVFVDAGVESNNGDDIDDESSGKPTKNDVISCLGVGGRWITTTHDLQIDSSDSLLMSLKCASVHFLFEDSWTLSRVAQGKYLHILSDVMHKLSKQVLRPTVRRTVAFDDCLSMLTVLDEQQRIGRVLVEM